MSNHSFTNVLEYIPKRYTGLSNKQKQDQLTVYDFKNGNCPSYARELLSDKIKDVVSSNPSEWVVCFIPASTKEKHIRRYYDLSTYLSNRLACPVYIDGIDVAYDRESGHMSGKTGNPISNMTFNPTRFSGKKVILVDDVRTRGITFDNAADKLKSLGAVSVFGVFLAQTIRPNLPIDPSYRSGGVFYDDVINDIFSVDPLQEDLANECMLEEHDNETLINEMTYDYAQEELAAEIYEDQMLEEDLIHDLI